MTPHSLIWSAAGGLEIIHRHPLDRDTGYGFRYREAAGILPEPVQKWVGDRDDLTPLEGQYFDVVAPGTSLHAPSTRTFSVLDGELVEVVAWCSIPDDPNDIGFRSSAANVEIVLGRITSRPANSHVDDELLAETIEIEIWDSQPANLEWTDE